MFGRVNMETDHNVILEVRGLKQYFPIYQGLFRRLVGHVKAVDGASNESLWSGTGWFYVGFSLAVPQHIIYLLCGVGALLLAVLTFWLGRKTAYY